MHIYLLSDAEMNKETRLLYAIVANGNGNVIGAFSFRTSVLLLLLLHHRSPMHNQHCDEQQQSVSD